MHRILVCVVVALLLCLPASLTHALQRGKGGGNARGAKTPERGQTERKPEGNAERGGESSRVTQEERGGKTEGKNAPGGEWSERTHSGTPSYAQGGNAAGEKKAGQATEAQGAAAGAAAANRNTPTATGAQGAAAGEAAANRNTPTATGAQGAAAGAAAANRNSPQYSGAEGAAAGAAAANRNSLPLAGAAAAGTGYAAVRNSFNQPGMYGRGWYGDHPGAWAPVSWGAGAAWAPATWGAVAGMYGYANTTPVPYNYGGNVNYQNGNVVVDGQPVGTAAEFSQQASDLAQTGNQADVSDTDKWLPLGVFAMVRNENQHPQLILQMAVNQQGILRGNYTDEVTDHTAPIHGAVDKQTQRVAWTVGDNQTTVMEAGLNNLTQNEAPALIHKNGKTDHWILVRLDQSKTDGASGVSATP